MEKIKKRITDSVKNLQLAQNEMDRLGILGKFPQLDADTIRMLDLLNRLANEIRHLSGDQSAS